MGHRELLTRVDLRAQVELDLVVPVLAGDLEPHWFSLAKDAPLGEAGNVLAARVQHSSALAAADLARDFRSAPAAAWKLRPNLRERAAWASPAGEEPELEGPARLAEPDYSFVRKLAPDRVCAREVLAFRADQELEQSGRPAPLVAVPGFWALESNVDFQICSAAEQDFVVRVNRAGHDRPGCHSDYRPPDFEGSKLCTDARLLPGHWDRAGPAGSGAHTTSFSAADDRAAKRSHHDPANLSHGLARGRLAGLSQNKCENLFVAAVGHKQLPADRRAHK